MGNWNRTFNIYGLYIHEQHILVVRRKSGPFMHQYDLPGGSVLEDEMLDDALKRHLDSYHVFPEAKRSLGTFDFLVAHDMNGKRLLHQICALYLVDLNFEKDTAVPLIFEATKKEPQTYKFLSFDQINAQTASPILVKAKELALELEAQSFL
ncbi:hypothetical protein [Listeria fleischmannii]|jgi:ADP-ribose pyrophosphatase YjhB (NUDIX family)|uniref:hypothetical protein n=1 Tax=Listeria fleischmannii TaxID=1069827 RepID=UPI00162579F6|nr:hypothetical protein [Listeria fleischmannii]MBC1417625.1 hypothetical protein [Listeria fleischmannii]